MRGRCVPFLSALLLITMVTVREGLACDACLEDKIAATYDWEVVSAAKRQGHTVIFTAIQGPVGPQDKRLGRRLTEELLAVPGVDAGSVRVALSPPAVSFSSNLAKRRVDAILQAANHRLRALRLKLVVVRIGAPAMGDVGALR